MTSVRVALMTMLAALAVLFANPAAGQPAGEGSHVAIELVPDTRTPRPGGEVTLAFVSRPEPGWHGYWKNPGDAGVETTLDWTLPPGVTAGPLQYPVPHRLLIAGLMNYVYEGPFTQFVTLKLADDLKAGTTLPIAVKADYLVCTDEICVPESRTLSTRLVVGDGTIAPGVQQRFDTWRRAMPKPLNVDATFEVKDGMFRLAIPFPASAEAVDPYFFPLASGVLDHAAPQTARREGDMLFIETDATGRPAGPIEGVLSTGEGQGFLLTAKPGAVAASGTGEAAGAGTGARTMLLAVLGALLGGVLLNIMPCVFPILSLKALSLAQSGESEARARRDALAYAAGVVLTCMALGGILLAIRAGGASAGWAFQLQNPGIILLLLLLVTAIALNLAGLFELPAPAFATRRAASGGGSFMTGALAAFVATPCTGPFMGAALGAALVLPWAWAMPVFAALGLGIALPFLLLGFVPALRRRLPRPGAWMQTFRHILAVPMFLTALALAWVLGRQAGVGGLTLGLAGVLVLSLALWWVGTRQRRGRSAAWWPLAPALVAGLAAVALVRPASEAQAPMLALDAQPFTEARLADLRARNRPVFAYFTADWCITCKVNEKAAIETAAVAKAFRQANVGVLVGDWTDGDPVLGRFIEAHNRAGVPLYLWYAPGAPAPRVLPQILTPSMLVNLPGSDPKD